FGCEFAAADLPERAALMCGRTFRELACRGGERLRVVADFGGDCPGFGFRPRPRRRLVAIRLDQDVRCFVKIRRAKAIDAAFVVAPAFVLSRFRRLDPPFQQRSDDGVLLDLPPAVLDLFGVRLDAQPPGFLEQEFAQRQRPRRFPPGRLAVRCRMMLHLLRDRFRLDLDPVHGDGAEARWWRPPWYGTGGAAAAAFAGARHDRSGPRRRTRPVEERVPAHCALSLCDRDTGPSPSPGARAAPATGVVVAPAFASVLTIW